MTLFVFSNGRTTPAVEAPDYIDEPVANLDADGKPYQRSAVWLPFCGARVQCGGYCILVPGHGGYHECVGDDEGWAFSCPA